MRKKRIVGKREDEYGRNYKLKLNTGEKISVAKAKELIEKGKLPDYNYVPASKNQRSYIRANPNKRTSDNIEEQRSF